MNCADVHLLPQKAGAADLVMPSKLTGMLATGRPVVASAKRVTQIASVVSECGIVVPPGDAASFADAVSALAADPARCRRLGAAARQHALQHMSRHLIMERFQHELGALISKETSETFGASDSPVAKVPMNHSPHFGAAETAATTGRESIHTR
jgi:colanic acid biosynthesis glycosyl transferase WcaI